MDLTNKNTLLACLKKHGLWAKKRFGQNFLIDKKTLALIVKAGKISSEDYVIEVGPGLGTLTREICKHAKKVTSIEADRDVIPILKDNLSEFKNLEIIQGDALKEPTPSIAYKVIANIPYSITSPLLTHFLTAENPPKRLVFLVQKEVAEKICAKKNSILSLQIQIHGEPKIIAFVPAKSFHPAPRVDSAILQIDIYKKPLIKNPEKALRLAKKAFTLKRKKLSNSLSNIKPYLEKLNLADKRPEELTIKNWEQLSEFAP